MKNKKSVLILLFLSYPFLSYGEKKSYTDKEIEILERYLALEKRGEFISEELWDQNNQIRKKRAIKEHGTKKQISDEFLTMIFKERVRSLKAGEVDLTDEKVLPDKPRYYLLNEKWRIQQFDTRSRYRGPGSWPQNYRRDVDYLLFDLIPPSSTDQLAMAINECLKDCSSRKNCEFFPITPTGSSTRYDQNYFDSYLTIASGPMGSNATLFVPRKDFERKFREYLEENKISLKDIGYSEESCSLNRTQRALKSVWGK